MAILLQLQNLPWKGDGGWKKVSLRRFLADREFVEKNVLRHPIARATSYCLLPDTSDYGPPKMPLKLAV